MTEPRRIPRQPIHNGTCCGGRPIRVPVGPRTVRQLLRRHLREEGARIQDLAKVWECKRKSVYDRLCDKRPLSPQHILAVVDLLKLDNFDKAELLLLGAQEAGWCIDPTYLIPDDDASERRAGINNPRSP